MPSGDGVDEQGRSKYYGDTYRGRRENGQDFPEMHVKYHQIYEHKYALSLSKW